MITSPLRYPGGKARLYPFFAALVNQNKLFGYDYYEPYAGGAGLAIKLLTSGFVDRIHLNDLDLSVYSFWKAVLTDTDRFCELIQEAPVTIEEWYRQREIWRSPSDGDATALGFATYFLNRTNRSGIIEGAGPIGGYAQAGPWKIDVRLVKSKQIANIIALSRYRDQIAIYNSDAMDFMKSLSSQENGLWYLDPPYYVKGWKLYKNYYKHDDHLEIARTMEARRDRTWVVSYDDTPGVRQMYSSFRRIAYNLQYSAGEKSAGREAIVLSDT